MDAEIVDTGLSGKFIQSSGVRDRVELWTRGTVQGTFGRYLKELD